MEKLTMSEMKMICGGASTADRLKEFAECMAGCGFPSDPGHYKCVDRCIEIYFTP
jgi:hypothetical protein